MHRRAIAATAAAAALGALGAIALSTQPHQNSSAASTTTPAVVSRTTIITRTIHDPVATTAPTSTAPASTSRPSAVDVSAAAAVDRVKSRLADDGDREDESGEGNDD